MKRNIVFKILVSLIALLVISCSNRQQLRIYNWTYYMPESIIEQFEEEYNVSIIYDEFASNEEMFAKLMATNREGLFGWISRLFGRSYDIVFPSGDYVPIMIQHGLLERIDKSKMNNLGNVDPEILRKAVYDPDMEYAVPYYYGAAGVIVNTAMVPEFERSWSIFAREDIGGRMTMLDDMREVIGAALTYLGFSGNSTDSEQITAAMELINTSWKPNLTKFDSDTFGQGYARGDFWIVHGFPELVFEEIPDDPDLLAVTEFFIPEEGAPAYIDNMVILKRSKNIDLAHQFIDFIHRPEIYAEFVDTFDFPASANVPARDYTTGNPMYTVEDLAGTELIIDIGAAYELYTDAWFNSIKID